MLKYRTDRLIKYLAIAVALSVACIPAAVEADQEYKIVIVKSQDIPQYNIALEGFFEVIDGRRISYTANSYQLARPPDEVKKMVEEIRDLKPDLIVTVGSGATGKIAGDFSDIPIVFSMVLYPAASAFVANMEKPGKNVTGAAMDVPVDRQFRLLSRIVPELKQIGVLYSPEETQSVIEDATRVAESLNMKLLAEPVLSESDVPKALDKLDKQQMDALWSVADGTVFTLPSARYIIEYVVRRGIPFMAPYNGLVKSGALVALTADYRDNGRQTGEIAVRVLRGNDPGEIAVATPRTVDMALNLQVANHIRLKIPQEVVGEASQVFE